jgi:hypothetical protein
LLSPPVDVREVTASERGTLPPGEYSYRVVAERPVTGGRAVSAPSEPVSVRLESAAGAVGLEWAAVEDAAEYRVYRRDGAGMETYWRVATTRVVDTGTPGTSGSPPRPTVWLVKNLLELKNARRVVIERNVLEHHWAQAQNGYAVLFTPRNQGGGAPWSRVEDVRFVDKVVRRVSAFLNVTGADDVRPSGRTRDIVVRNNLLVEVGVRGWGGNGDFVQLGHGPVNVTIEQNTVAQTGRMLSVYGSARLGRTIGGLVFRGNVLRHNRYGVVGADAAPGRGTFSKYLPDAVFTGNVIAGGRASAYPRENHFIGEEEFIGLFVNPESGNYRLREGMFTGAGVAEEVLDAVALRTTAAGGMEGRPQSRR